MVIQYIQAFTGFESESKEDTSNLYSDTSTESWAPKAILFNKGKRNAANRIPQNYIYVVHLSSHCNIHIVHFVTSISNNFEYIFTV